MKRNKLIVTIDGPAAAGKSTAGKSLAADFDYLYIDSGALYRAVSLKALRKGIDLGDGAALERMIRRTRLQPERTDRGMRMILDGEDITDELKGEKTGFAASTVSALPEVRRALLHLQRDLGREGGIVMDGRDIGTVIFPDAEAKFFLNASPEARGKRRWLEMKATGEECTEEQVVEDIRRRDLQDITRSNSPLMQAPDAVVIDTTDTTPDQVLAIMKDKIAALRARR